MSVVKRWLLGFVVLLIALYWGIINIIVPHYLTAAIPNIETIANAYINGKVDISGLKVSNTLEITAKDIVVSNKAGKEVAKAPSVIIGFSLFKGLMGADVVSAIENIDINEPVVRVNMDKDDKLDIAELLKQKNKESNNFQGTVHIINGQLVVATPYGMWTTGVQGDVSAAGNQNYALDLDVSLRNEILSIVGKLNTSKVGALTLKTKAFSLDEFTALIEHYVPVSNISGSIRDLHVLWKNDGHSVGMSGSGRFFQAAGTVVSSTGEERVTLDGKVKVHEMTFTAEQLNVTVNGEKAQINGSVDLTDSKNPKAQDLSVVLKSFNPAKIITSLPVDGAFSGKLILNGTQKTLGIKGNLTVPELVIAGKSIYNVQVPLSMQDGKIEFYGAVAQCLEGKISLHGSYELTTGKILADVGMQQVNLALLPELQGESIIADGEMAVQGYFDQKHLKLSTAANLMTLKWRGTIFRNLALDMDIDKNSIVVNNFSVFSDNGGAMIASGSWKNGIVDAKAHLSDLPLEPFLQLDEKDISGNLSGVFTIQGPLSSVRVAGNASLGAGKILGEKFKAAKGLIAFQNNMLQINKLKVDMDQGEHLLEGKVDMSGTTPVLDINITTNNVRAESIANYFAPNIELTGNLDNEAHIFGALDKLRIIGKMHLWDGSCKKFLVDDIAGSYDYNAGALNLKKFKLKALTTNIDFEGNMDSAGNLNFVMDARQIHLERIPRLGAYAKVEGVADFSGRVKGTIKTPLFAGALTSNSIKINGEELNGLAFFVESKGGMVNKLNGTFEQGAGGDYEAVLLLDLEQGLLQGTLNVTNGNIKSMARMAKENFDIKGLLNGKIVINKEGKGSGISVIGNVNQGSVRNIEFKDIGFNLFYKKGLWQINNMKAQEDNGGFIAAQGSVDLRKRKIALEVGCNKANAAILTAFTANPVDFGGIMDFTAQLTGDLDNPQGNISLQVSQGKLAGITFDNLYGMVTLRDDMFKLEQLMLEKSIYKVSAYGTFPRDLLRAQNERKNPEAQMDLKVKLNNANLSILPSLTKWIDWGIGDTNGGVEISGTLEDPEVNGSIVINQGTVKVKDMTTLVDNLKMKVDFKGKQVNLNELSANIGKGGSFVAHGNFAFTDVASAPYLLEFAAKNVQVESTYFNGTINADGTVAQKRKRPHLSAKLRLDNVLLNIPAIPDIEQGNSNVGFDVTLELGPNIHLRNKYMYDLWLAGALHIIGSTRFPNIEGSIEATKGTISYIRTPFNIKRASVAWPVPGVIMPFVSFEATTRFSRYNIMAKADGSADELNIALSSNPPKSQKELLRMLTLKTTGNNATSSLNNDNVQGLVDAGLQMTFMGDIEDFMRQTFAFDEFRIYNGNVRSSIGFDLDSLKAESFTNEDRNQYNILVSKHILKPVMVGYSTSFDQEYHSTFAEYDINDKISLNFSRDEKNRRWYGIQYQISF